MHPVCGHVNIHLTAQSILAAIARRFSCSILYSHLLQPALKTLAHNTCVIKLGWLNILLCRLADLECPKLSKVNLKTDGNVYAMMRVRENNIINMLRAYGISRKRRDSLWYQKENRIRHHSELPRYFQVMSKDPTASWVWMRIVVVGRKWIVLHVLSVC